MSGNTCAVLGYMLAAIGAAAVASAVVLAWSWSSPRYATSRTTSRRSALRTDTSRNTCLLLGAMPTMIGAAAVASACQSRASSRAGFEHGLWHAVAKTLP
ncbi:hypothetical protein PR001_g24487 [Phytophthora rubi]|uniref:Uncharacterized protein n=1 Tax=Phytophthora rubi TaxID=129364 RepID=A0A6A3IA32_9STRA|nr:hypothetical protein PR002_g24744 [Phytophthora rubi]KAE8979672.1 hypothetical protein PR001_g24487 [Phytophthora rubi]